MEAGASAAAEEAGAEVDTAAPVSAAEAATAAPVAAVTAGLRPALAFEILQVREIAWRQTARPLALEALVAPAGLAGSEVRVAQGVPAGPVASVVLVVLAAWAELAGWEGLGAPAVSAEPIALGRVSGRQAAITSEAAIA